MTPIARTLSVLLALGLPAAAQTADDPAPAAAPLGAAERDALEGAGRAGLEDLRAAAFGPSTRLDDSERALLREAASRHPELADLRAGELNLSDREVKIILITAAVVVVIALIL
jgi:hypothetical protein